MSIVRLDEPALFAAGLTKVNIEMLRHLLTTAGKVVGAPTLPETVVETQINTTNVSDLDADRNDGSGRDNTTARALADIAAELVREHTSFAAVLRRLDEVAAAMESLTLANQTLSRRIADLENGVN